jgi:O-antigen/teichoic acid export membrane protein
MILSAGFTLFASRWVLDALGQTDFGLYSLVGSVIVFIIFLNSVMSGSASRFYSLSIGRGDSQELTNWFNAAFGLHAGLATILVLLGWPLGEWVVSNWLTVPADRQSTCLWVFRVSLVSAFVNMVSVPFVGMFYARQRIAELAVWGLLQTFLVFCLGYSIGFFQGDRLMAYSIGMVGILVVIQSIQVGRAIKLFPECIPDRRRCFDLGRVRRIASFAGWNLIGTAGSLLRDQGTAILLNLNYGPRMNAAYGVATQVSAQTNQLASAMLGAFTPEITAREGRGERGGMLSLAHQASKFGTILVMLFAIPLMIEMDFVLRLWLHDPPAYAAGFCRFMLATFLVERTTTGLMIALNAKGAIAAYQITVGGGLLLTLPLAWILVRWTGIPTSVGAAILFTMVGVSLGRAFWAAKHLESSIGGWLKGVVLPCLVVGTLSALAGGTLHAGMEDSIPRLLLVGVLSGFATLCGAWYIAFTAKEREFFMKKAVALKSRFGFPGDGRGST